MKSPSRSASIKAAAAYASSWMRHQMERHRQVGCAVAISDGDKLVYEQAFGLADFATKEALTPRHRFRVASHSKSFTAAGIMKLREQGQIGLDDKAGRYVGGLSKALGEARISELLSHGAGVARDGGDAGYWVDRKPFLSRQDLASELAVKPPMEAGLQLKYSNHGYGLLGLVIETISGQSYCDWIGTNVIRAAGLKETTPDFAPAGEGVAMAKGHSADLIIGRRVVVPGDNPTNALAPATGFVSTAADLARFFNQISPAAKSSFLTPASRREMVHRRWRDKHSLVESHYGLGIASGGSNDQQWFGHSGGFPGFITCTAHYPRAGLTFSVLCNGLDGLASPWSEGLANIFRAFLREGAPRPKLADWSGRWWSLWGATDFTSMGDKVFVTAPYLFAPFGESASEIAIEKADVGRIVKSSAFGSPGEPVRLIRDKRRRVVEVWIGASRLRGREAVAKEMIERYEPPPGPSPELQKQLTA